MVWILKNKGITLVALVITVIILLILAGVTIMYVTGNGLFEKTTQAKETVQKEQATEKMNLKITNMQISSWADKQEMPTLQYLADGFCQDEEVQYVEVATQKTASFLLPQIDASNLDSIFVKLKEYPYEFEINKSLQLASIDGVDVAVNNPTKLEGCSRYIKVNCTGYMGQLKLSVNIPSVDDELIEEIGYYINDELIYTGKEKTYTVEGLQTDVEYNVYAIVKYKSDKIVTVAVSKGCPEADIYVSTEGNDSTGNGTLDYPYASVSKAIQVASSGAKIYILPGTYNLTPMNGEESYAQVGISDQNKKLEIFGANESTILIYDGSISNQRDCNLLHLGNEETIVRNVSFKYYPGKSYNYGNAIFRWSKRNTSKCIYKCKRRYSCII